MAKRAMHEGRWLHLKLDRYLVPCCISPGEADTTAEGPSFALEESMASPEAKSGTGDGAGQVGPRFLLKQISSDGAQTH